MIGSHHGLKGIGNKSTSNHKRHDQPFCEGVVTSPPVFAGISIVEFPVTLKKLTWGCRIAVYHHFPHAKSVKLVKFPAPKSTSTITLLTRTVPLRK